MSIHTEIRKATELAQTYAMDGAFHTAASILRDTANVISAHATRCDAIMKDAAGDPVNLQGSGPAPIETREG